MPADEQKLWGIWGQAVGADAYFTASFRRPDYDLAEYGFCENPVCCFSFNLKTACG